MGKMRTFDPKLTNVIIPDMGVVTGYSKDSLITFEYDEERFFEHVDAQGNEDRARNANESGNLTIHLRSTSPWIKMFYKRSQLKGDDDRMDLSVEDMNTDAITISGNGCYVKELPEISKGKEIEDVPVVIRIPKAVID